MFLFTIGAMNQEATFNAEENTRETQKSNEDHREQRQRVRDRQLTLMTVAMTLAFFICKAPTFIHLVGFYYYDPQSSPEMQNLYGWSSTVVMILNTLTSAMNFIMYALTGSKFLSDFKNLICFQRKII